MSNEVKDYMSIDEMATQLGVSIITVKRMIGKGELPGFTYGTGINDKVKGWHRKVLEAHAVGRIKDNQ